MCLVLFYLYLLNNFTYPIQNKIMWLEWDKDGILKSEFYDKTDYDLILA